MQRTEIKRYSQSVENLSLDRGEASTQSPQEAGTDQYEAEPDNVSSIIVEPYYVFPPYITAMIP
jgi:hypothetical protein